MEPKSNKKLIILTVLITAVVTVLTIFAGLKLTGINLDKNKNIIEQDNTDSQESKERKIIYWRAPMDPMEIYDEDRKSVV